MNSPDRLVPGMTHATNETVQTLLDRLRSQAGARQTIGLQDTVIADHAARDERLFHALTVAVAARDNLSEELASLVAMDEAHAVHHTQVGFLNFYPQHAVNPFIPLAAHGPWVVTTHGAVLHDNGGYGMLGFGHAPTDVIDTMAKYDNICNYIHLPVQSGSDTILKKMNRQHSRKEYFELVDKIRKKIPSCAISHDMIAGFPSETEQDHQDTLSLMEYVKYDFGFMFAYSERPGTLAAKKIEDDIPTSTKKRRLQEIIDLQRVHSEYRTQQFIGKTVCVLIEKSSKRSSEFWSGRTSQNTVAVFPKEKYKVGDFVDVKIDEVTSATLIGTAMCLSSSI